MGKLGIHSGFYINGSIGLVDKKQKEGKEMKVLIKWRMALMALVAVCFLGSIVFLPVAFASDGDFITVTPAGGSHPNGVLRLFAGDGSGLIRELGWPGLSFSDVTTLPDGTFVTVCDGATAGAIVSFDNALTGPGWNFGWYGAPFTGVDVTPDGDFITVSSDGILRLFAGDGSGLIRELGWQSLPFSDVATLPDGTFVTVGPTGNIISFNNALTGPGWNFNWYGAPFTGVDAFSVANQSPVALCKNVIVSAGSNCTANANIDNGSYDPDDDTITIVQSLAGPYGLGSTVVTLTVTDSEGASSSCQSTVTVVDNTPPALNVTVVKPMLWPPNHEMVEAITYTTSDNCSAVTVNMNVVVADALGGAGNTAVDSELGDGVVLLRAERSGKGSGRTYTVTLTAKDESGNSTTVIADVKVPHDSRK